MRALFCCSLALVLRYGVVQGSSCPLSPEGFVALHSHSLATAPGLPTPTCVQVRAGRSAPHRVCATGRPGSGQQHSDPSPGHLHRRLHRPLLLQCQRPCSQLHRLAARRACCAAPVCGQRGQWCRGHWRESSALGGGRRGGRRWRAGRPHCSRAWWGRLCCSAQPDARGGGPQRALGADRRLQQRHSERGPCGGSQQWQRCGRGPAGTGPAQDAAHRAGGQAGAPGEARGC